MLALAFFRPSPERDAWDLGLPTRDARRNGCGDGKVGGGVELTELGRGRNLPSLALIA